MRHRRSAIRLWRQPRPVAPPARGNQGRRGRWAIGLLLTAFLALTIPASAQALTVYAAASLREALPRIAPNPDYSFLGSGALQIQIERGAPADVFVSASPKEARELYRGGHCYKQVTVATNVLVMLVPEGNPSGISSVYSLRSGDRRLAVGVTGVPIGDHTRKLLARLRLTSILSTNTVSYEPNVTGITGKVALGSAEAGFAYVTDARIAADRVDVVRLPRWAQPPVRYRACLVRRSGADTKGGKAFLKRVQSKRGRRILKRNGFGLPRKHRR